MPEKVTLVLAAALLLVACGKGSEGTQPSQDAATARAAALASEHSPNDPGVGKL